MVSPCGNRKRQETEIISSLPKGLAHFSRDLQVKKTAGNIMIAEYSIIVNKARNTITILDIPLAFALPSKT